MFWLSRMSRWPIWVGNRRPMVVDQGEVVREVTDMGMMSAIWWSLGQDMVGEWWARSTTCLRGWSLGVTVKVGVDVARDASGVKHFVPGR